jgi:ribosomal protein S18 acetylase RimI-like enzyme
LKAFKNREYLVESKSLCILIGAIIGGKHSMESINILRATPDGLDQLQKIGRQTFFETFSAGNTEENMKSYLEEGFSAEKLTAELIDRNSELYFAWLNGEVIGYLKLNFGPSQTELKDEGALEIERIYLLKEYHGKKVGQLLYEKAMEIAREKNADYVWLGVWEENRRAISFYKKNGFQEFDKHIFKLGEDEQTDIMMKLNLKDKKPS